MPIQNTEQVVEAQKGKPRCIIYFVTAQTQVVKELAGDIRAQNKIANLVTAALFDESMVESCHAVAIQASSPKAGLIARMYRKHRPDTEQHFFDNNGEWVDPPEFEQSKSFDMPKRGSQNDEPTEPAPPSAEEIAATKAALTADMPTDSVARLPDEIPETQDEVNERADAEAEESREEIENSAGPFDAIAPEDADDDAEEITKS